MKYFALVSVMILVFALVACNAASHTANETTTYNYIYTPTETTIPATYEEATLGEEETTLYSEELESYTQMQEESTAQETTTFIAETTHPVQTTAPAPETTIPAETTMPAETTTQSAAETTTTASVSDFTLNMSVPDANGTMEVDLSEDNKYTQIVVSQRGIDVSLLVAVYSVPESGQNYVFEFSAAGTENRTAENIRRVYLIDSSGKITYVSAASSSEAENVSTVENWFNMNVLIKGLIFPAIEDKLK